MLSSENGNLLILELANKLLELSVLHVVIGGGDGDDEEGRDVNREALHPSFEDTALDHPREDGDGGSDEQDLDEPVLELVLDLLDHGSDRGKWLRVNAVPECLRDSRTYWY